MRQIDEATRLAQSIVPRPTNRVRVNLAANYVGSGLSAILALAFLPLYIRLLGVEAFGLIGLFATITAIAGLLEFGLTASVGRLLANSDQGTQIAIHETVSTLEYLFLGIGALICLALCVIAPLLAWAWLNPGQLDHATIGWSMFWMAIGFGCRWNVAFYSAGLNGLERQVGLNIVLVVTSAMQYGGVLVVLWMLAAPIPAFFAFQALCGLIQALVLRRMMWSHINRSLLAKRWAPKRLVDVGAFAGGMTLISLTSVALTQVDRVILSRLMSLATFGVYTFASNAASATSRIAQPIFNAVYPRLTRLAAANDTAAFDRLYALSAQTMACLVVPAVATIYVLAEPLLLLWTQQADLASESTPLFRVILLGNMLNALMYVPYARQLAHGWTAFAIRVNLISIMLLVPCGIFAYRTLGAIGVAILWPLLNLGYISVAIPVMHHKLGRRGMRTWYAYGVALPIAVSFAIAHLVSLTSAANGYTTIYLATFAWALASAICIVLLPSVRRLVFDVFQRLRLFPKE